MVSETTQNKTKSGLKNRRRGKRLRCGEREGVLGEINDLDHQSPAVSAKCLEALVGHMRETRRALEWWKGGEVEKARISLG